MNKNVLRRTTIALKVETKKRLDDRRAPGQSYDGFISQILSSWEQKLDNLRSSNHAQGELRVISIHRLKNPRPLP
jgi:hypothetical protein